jgi:hypothetical protein
MSTQSVWATTEYPALMTGSKRHSNRVSHDRRFMVFSVPRVNVVESDVGFHR